MRKAGYDRPDALGAWAYTMPTDGSPETVDWEWHIKGMKKIPYDPKKFFWWRNYRPYGTGVAGDWFVHLLCGTHLITGSTGADKIYASGQWGYRKDGRKVAGVMESIVPYPQKPEHSPFELTLQGNFVSGTGGSEATRFVGDEGTITISPDAITVHHNKMPGAPAIGRWDRLATYPDVMQKQLINQYHQKYSPEQQKRHNEGDLVYKAPPDYDAHLPHHITLCNYVRNGTPVLEDALFGFWVAAPPLAGKESYFENKIIYWDPLNMEKIKS